MLFAEAEKFALSGAMAKLSQWPYVHSKQVICLQNNWLITKWKYLSSKWKCFVLYTYLVYTEISSLK